MNVAITGVTKLSSSLASPEELSAMTAEYERKD
jgi:hypothetical protein